MPGSATVPLSAACTVAASARMTVSRSYRSATLTHFYHVPVHGCCITSRSAGLLARTASVCVKVVCGTRTPARSWVPATGRRFSLFHILVLRASRDLRLRLLEIAQDGEAKFARCICICAETLQSKGDTGALPA